MVKRVDSVLTYYQGVVEALVPFAVRGKLNEGLNKFRARIHPDDLEEIRYEVSRLIAPSQDSADNSKFAEGRPRVIRVNDIKVKLDPVGERILNAELKRYRNVYTAGVQEAISSPKRYQHQIKKEAYDKLVESFSVDCFSSNETPQLDQIKVVPPFSVTSPLIDDNAPLNIHYLAKNELSLSFAQKPKLYGGEAVSFTFPPLGRGTDSQTTGYVCRKVTALPGGKAYAVVFSPDSEDNAWAQQVEQYIRDNMHELPLVAEQEEDRARHQLLKDCIVANMPMTATLCSQQDGQLQPQFTLKPMGWKDTQDSNPLASGLSLCCHRFAELSKEFRKGRETYQFSYNDWVDGKQVRIVGYLHELKRDRTLATFIKNGIANQTLQVLRVTMVNVDDQRVQESLPLDGHDAALIDGGLKYVLYCADVSRELEGFSVALQPKQANIPPHYRESDMRYSPAVSIPRQHDRRSEPRYDFSSKVVVKPSMMQSIDGQIIDLSTRGLRIKLFDAPRRLREQVKVNLPSLSLSGIRYQVVRYDDNEQELRLHMTDDSAARFSRPLTKMQLNNADFFASRSQTSQQERVFQYLWKLVALTAPGVHILLGKGKDVKDQLLVAHTDGAAKNLLPFKVDNQRLPTHGWFADGHNSNDGLDRLANFVSKQHDSDRSLFYIDKSARRYTQLSPSNFNKAPIRQQLHGAIAANRGQLVVHHLQSAPYRALDDSWYIKRCQHLSKMDRVAVKRIRRQEAERHRVLTILPVTILHANLLSVGDFSKPFEVPAMATA